MPSRLSAWPRKALTTFLESTDVLLQDVLPTACDELSFTTAVEQADDTSNSGLSYCCLICCIVKCVVCPSNRWFV